MIKKNYELRGWVPEEVTVALKGVWQYESPEKTAYCSKPALMYIVSGMLFFLYPSYLCGPTVICYCSLDAQRHSLQ